MVVVVRYGGGSGEGGGGVNHLVICPFVCQPVCARV